MDQKNSAFATTQSGSIIDSVIRILFLVFAFTWVPFLIIAFSAETIEIAGINIDFVDFNLDPVYATEVARLTPFLHEIFLNNYINILVVGLITCLLSTLFFAHGRNIIESMALILLLALPRRRKFYGIIFDSQTGRPISFANIKVKRRIGVSNYETIITQSISDLDGRYRIHLLDKNLSYILEVSATDYETFKKEISANSSTIFRNEITEDIPMKRISLQNSPMFFNFLYTFKSRISSYFTYFVYALSLISFLFSFYGALAYNLSIPIRWIAYAHAFSIVWNTFIINERITINYGKILEKSTQTAVAGALLSFFDEKQSLGTFISDATGTVKVNLRPGRYVVKITRDGYKIAGQESTESTVIVKITQDGYLETDIYLEKTMEVVDVNTNLMNPFA